MDEISQFESNPGVFFGEILREEIEGLKEKNKQLEADISKKDEEIKNFTELFAVADLKFTKIVEKFKERDDLLRHCYVVSGLSFVAEILEVFTKYNKQNHPKLIMIEKSRNFQQAQKELTTASKSVMGISKDKDPPGYFDVVCIEPYSNSYKNFLKREKKRNSLQCLHLPLSLPLPLPLHQPLPKLL